MVLCANVSRHISEASLFCLRSGFASAHWRCSSGLEGCRVCEHGLERILEGRLTLLAGFGLADSKRLQGFDVSKQKELDDKMIELLASATM